MHILLVDDDPPLCDLIERTLQAQGWSVDTTARGEPVVRSVRQDAYDLVVLDVGLAGIDGFEVLRRLRADGAGVPVMMLIAYDALEDRLRALAIGADDYLVKPFALHELVARVRVLVCRHRVQGEDVLAIGDLRMDLHARRVFVGAASIDISMREWSVLEVLLGRAGRVVAKDHIINAVSGWSESLSENAVEQYVSRVRIKIAPAGVQIRSVRGLGYVLEAKSARSAQA